ATRLTFARHVRTLELPDGPISRVVPWTLPLPAPVFSVRLAPRPWMRDGLGAAAPTPLLAALAAAGVHAAHAAVEHPTCVYAAARARRAPRRWYHLLGRFVVFALVPTAVLFNAHQHIA